MNKVFDLNNPVWQFIGKVVDATILHFCWLICCLPIVTIGASTTALYYALMKDCADEGTHFVRQFFKSFKQNLKQGIFLSLILLAVGGILAYATWFYMQQDSGKFWDLLKGVSIAACVFYVFTLQYIFPLLARFDTKIGNLIKNALLLSIRHIGWTVVMVFVLAAELFLAFYVNFLPILIPGYGLVVYLDCYILNHVLKPYIKAAGGDTGEYEGDPDAWTVPEEDEETTEAAGELQESERQEKDSEETGEKKENE